MIEMFSLFLTLLVLFQIKHFICDYPLQNQYMLGKFKPTGWVLPLAAHCGVHAIYTFVAVMFFTNNIVLSLALTVFDFTTHFTMDRIKASPKILGRFKPDDPKFWWALGLDQMVHHLTHYVIIAVVILDTFTHSL